MLVALSFIFQIWTYNQGCLKIICGNVVLWITYYIFWPFDLLNIFILEIIPATRNALFIDKVLFILIQAVYWHLISCIIAYPMGRVHGKLKISHEEKEREEEREMKAKIEKDLREAEELENAKKLKKEHEKKDHKV